MKELDHLTNLQELSLGINRITKLKGVDHLMNLQELSLCYNQITKLEGLDGLTALQRLDLKNNPVFDQISGKSAQEVVYQCKIMRQPDTQQRREAEERQRQRNEERYRREVEERQRGIPKTLVEMILLQRGVDIARVAQIYGIPADEVRASLFALASDGKIQGEFDWNLFRIMSDLDKFITILDQQLRQSHVKNARKG